MNKKKLRFSKRCIIGVLVSVGIFTAVMIYIFCRWQTVPDSLIVAFFGFCGCEAGVLGWIKRGDRDDKTDTSI